MHEIALPCQDKLGTAQIYDDEFCKKSPPNPIQKTTTREVKNPTTAPITFMSLHNIPTINNPRIGPKMKYI